MTAFEQAVEDLNERMRLQGTEHGDVTHITGEPEDILRATLSGYVPLEDTDRAMSMCNDVAEAILHLIMHSQDRASATAGVAVTVAQVLVVGAATERRSQ